MKKIENVLCPICSNTSTLAKNLSSEFTRKELSKYFKVKIDNNIEILDYQMFRCNVCNYDFAFPETEGSSSFYNFVTSQQSYYTSTRWEYMKMLQLLPNENIKLLDVGCGDGKFFDNLIKNGINTINFCGIDTTIQSVQTCQSKGHNVYCMDIQTYKEQNSGKLFDAIVSFHCLEHIAKPKEFLQELLSILNPSGTIYLSTPFSPMDFELDWFDVLNHPPHHMGRWNLKSYSKLAEILNLNLEVFMPDPMDLIHTSLLSFLFSLYGHSNNFTKPQILFKIILHPLMFSTHLLRQYKREKFNKKRSANVILVKFSRKYSD